MRSNLRETTFTIWRVFTTKFNYPKKKPCNLKGSVEQQNLNLYSHFFFIDLCSCHDHTPKNMRSPIPAKLQNKTNHLGISLGNNPGSPQEKNINFVEYVELNEYQTK